MKFKGRLEIDKFYKSLREGQRIEITRDLSSGRLLEEMIQTVSIKVGRENRDDIRLILSGFPIIEMKRFDG